jgi:hypothetical protein
MDTGWILADAPVRKDVVLAVIGAAAAVGGLVLVFLALVVSAFKGFGAEVDVSIRARFERSIKGLFASFALSLASAGLGVTWLATRGGAGMLYEAAVWTFLALLLGTLMATGWTICRLVL